MAEPPNPDLPEFEPVALQAPVPISFLVAFFGLFYLSTLYLDKTAGGFHAKVYEPFTSHDLLAAIQPQDNVDPHFEKGRDLYKNFCSPCHQENGAGSSVLSPPLAGSDWVNAEGPNRIIRVVLNGLTGPIQLKVNGDDKTFSGAMLPWRNELDDEQLAAILTYIRGQSEWGNNAGPVMAEQVKAIRDETANRTSAWTQPELFQIPEL